MPALALILVAGLLVYAGTFNAPFVFDDKPNITENPFIRMTRLTPESLRNALISPNDNRLLANFSFALNYYFHQYRPVGYHLINIFIHLFNAWLVLLVARKTFFLCHHKEEVLIPLLAALLWLVNPVHTQSVTYIVQRMNSMFAMFYLLSLLFYIQARLDQRRSGGTSFRPVLLFASCALAGLFGLASKEAAATLPIMIFLYEWYFFQGLDAAWSKKKAPFIGFLILPALIIISLIYVGSRPGDILAGYKTRPFDLQQRLMTQPGAVIYYLSLLAFPHPERLTLDYDFPVSFSLMTPPTTLLSITAILMLTIAAIKAARRNRMVSFAVLWFLGNLVIESSVIPLELVYEHRTYLPSVFPFIGFVWLAFFCLRPRALAVAMLCVVIGFSALWTYERNSAWRDDVSLWRDNVAKSPRKARTRNNLGQVYRNSGRLEEALACFNAALDRDEAYEKAYNNIGITLTDSGRPAEAVPYLRQAIALKPGYDDALYNLGLALNNMGKIDEAESCYARTLELNPFYERAHNNIGIIKINRGLTDEAIDHFESALSIDPCFENAYNNLGIACFRSGEVYQALRYFKKAIALKPDYEDAAQNLEKASRALKQYGQAIARLQKARLKHPDDPEMICRLATTCRSAGMLHLAVDLYEQALSLSPENKKYLDVLSVMYKTINRYERAAQILEKLVLLCPDNPDFFYRLASVYAQSNQKEKAIINLRTAVGKGFSDIGYIRADESLAAIRDTDYFRTLTTDRR